MKTMNTQRNPFNHLDAVDGNRWGNG